ncbi:hypothetical protein D0469_20335 [Peribacillus saganii]|uniref:Uncharacterized protein n=1 Tax=Peribacillus saganii TaxID=2303992 RepID=A0A372LAC4_9BACI|nr:hypothetical protein D0469_20335 [Peribacillus saganii]
MKITRFIVSFSSFVLTTGILYLLGHMFTIPLLMYHYEFIDDGAFYTTTGSVVPFLIGISVSFFAERLYNHKYHQKLG